MTKLASLGYAPELIQRVKKQKNYKALIQTTIKLHADLINDFNHEQIVRIVARTSGHVGLQAVHTHREWLKNHYSSSQITRMASHKGGSKNLKSVKDNHAALIALGFSAEQIVQIVNHKGGSKNLEAVLSYCQYLGAHCVDLDEIVKLIQQGNREQLKQRLREAQGVQTAGSETESVEEFLNRLLQCYAEEEDESTVATAPTPLNLLPTEILNLDEPILPIGRKRQKPSASVTHIKANSAHTDSNPRPAKRFKPSGEALYEKLTRLIPNIRTMEGTSLFISLEAGEELKTIAANCRKQMGIQSIRKQKFV